MRVVVPSLLFVASCLGTALAYYGAQSVLPPVPVPQSISEVAALDAVPQTPQEGLRPLPALTDAQRMSLQERPLFSETRRPAAFVEQIPPEPEPEPIIEDIEPEPVFEPPVYEEPEPVPPPDLTFVGYIRADGVARVLLLDQQTGLDRWYAVGAMIDGWEIVAIEQDRVEFVQQGIEFVVKLER